MIHFLRKMRHQLLSENRFRSYLVYAVGEIVLVVVGILIALQIDNWNEQRNIEEKELVFLNRLLVDLRNDKDYLETVYARKSNKIEAANAIIKFAFIGNQDSILRLIPAYLDLTSWQTIIPNQNTFDELISSGSLNILKSDSLKNSLLQLDRNYKSLVDWEEVVKQDAYINNLWSQRDEMNPYNYLSVNKSLSQELELVDELIDEKRVLMSNQLQKDVERIMKSNKFRTGVLSSRDDYVNQLNLITILKTDVDNLIALVEKELSRRD